MRLLTSSDGAFTDLVMLAEAQGPTKHTLTNGVSTSTATESGMVLASRQSPRLTLGTHRRHPNPSIQILHSAVQATSLR